MAGIEYLAVGAVLFLVALYAALQWFRGQQCKATQEKKDVNAGKDEISAVATANAPRANQELRNRRGLPADRHSACAASAGAPQDGGSGGDCSGTGTTAPAGLAQAGPEKWSDVVKKEVGPGLSREKSRTSSGSWTDVSQKSDQAEVELDQESRALAAVEEELRTAEARVATAETHYNLARSQVATELAKPLVEEKPDVLGVQSTTEDLDIEADAAVNLVEAQGGHTQRATKSSKNASAMTDKQVSRDRWLAQRAAEGRVRDATKRVRERLRRSQRDKRFDSLDPEGLQGEAEHPVKTEAKPAASQPPAVRELGLFESAAIMEGAQGIANRLKNHPDAVDKRTSLVKVLIGGRENVYTFELSDVVVDLQERGLIETRVADEVLKLLSETAPAPKPASVPQEEWLAHAQKISNVEPLDKPLKDVETTYLKWLEEKRVSVAEAELAAAEAKLQATLSQAETRYPEVCQDNGSQASQSPRRRVSGTGPEVDLDEAARLEALHGSDPVSRGSKNASALSEKVVSKERWEAARGSENRAREKEVKAREVGRAEARDRKMDAVTD